MALKLQLGYPFLLLSHHSSSYPHPKNLFLLLFFKNLPPSHFSSLSLKSPRASFGDVPFNDLTNPQLDDSPSPSSSDVLIDDDDDVTEGEEKDESLMTSSSPSPSSSGLTNPADVCYVPRNDVTKEEEGGEERWMTSSWSGDVMEDEMVNRASMMKDAKEVMEMIREDKLLKREGGVVLSPVDCRRIIEAALHCNNSDLALSIFAAMRSSTVVRENGGLIGNWRWSRPDLSIYTTLVLGLAASLRVSDALQIISDICRVGASPAEEVPFGKVVRCPTCQIAVTVVQPQQGIQVWTSR